MDTGYMVIYMLSLTAAEWPYQAFFQAWLPTKFLSLSHLPSGSAAQYGRREYS